MLAHILVEPGHIELRDIETPTASSEEIVVKIRSALTCGTDLKAFRRGHPMMPMPTLFGHEFSGDIVEVGESVKGFKIGDAVMAVHTYPCLKCYYCERGLENLCESVMQTKVLGAYAEYIKLPAGIVRHNLYRKPDFLSYNEAAILEPLSCVVYGIDQVTVREDDTVLIIGAGPIGLMHLMVIRTMKVRRIIVAARRAERLALASKFGADVVINAETEDTVEQVMAECTGKLDVWERTIWMASRGATIVLFGGCPKGTTATFDTARLHYDEITLKGTFHFTRAAVRKAYQFLVGRKIQVNGLISGEYPYTELRKVFERLINGQGVKYALVPEMSS
jgi:L-iditol 2-dehydrogenase